MLHGAQHGFTHKRSTLTYLLVCDANVATLLFNKHPFDIISFDFVKAFNKVPHHSVISALMNIGIRETALRWFSSFLTGRTFCVRIEQEYSIRSDVISGVVQGSIIGPALDTVFINPLLKKTSFPCRAFADDLKFIADVIENNQNEIQQEVSSIFQ